MTFFPGFLDRYRRVYRYGDGSGCWAQSGLQTREAGFNSLHSRHRSLAVLNPLRVGQRMEPTQPFGWGKLTMRIVQKTNER